jgi:hypothetical protein
MRTELLTYLTAQLTASIKTSQELPFQEGTNPLYMKNARRVYWPGLFCRHTSPCRPAHEPAPAGTRARAGTQASSAHEPVLAGTPACASLHTSPRDPHEHGFGVTDS